MAIQHVAFEDKALWYNANEYLRSIGGLPLFLTSAVRAVRNARILFQSEDSPHFKDAISQTIRRLFLAPSYKASFFEAVREYRPQRLGELQEVSSREVIDIFSADEVVAIISTYYLFRRLQTLIPEEDFDPLCPRIRTAVALGHFVGQLIDGLGPGQGIIVSVSQVFALGIFCKHTPSVYREYRRKMRVRKELFNPELEVEFFNTTTQHVAAAIIQACGYGTAPAVGMYCQEVPRHTDAMVRIWSKARRILEVLQQRGTAVSRDELSHLDVISKAKMNELLERVGTIMSQLTASSWLFTGKQDGLDLIESQKSISPEGETEAAP